MILSFTNKMILSLGIAFKFYRSYKRNVLVSFVSLISVIGIIIGVFVAIIAFSVINGFQNELDRRILSIIPHGEIIPIHTDTASVDYTKLIKTIANIPDIVYINPYVNFSGIIQFRQKYHLIHVKSVNFDQNNVLCNRNYRLINFIEKQSWKYFCHHKNQIILGQGVSKILKIKLGDWITILFTHGNVNMKSEFSSFNKIQVQVAGILNLHSQFDENLAIMNFSDIRNLYKSPMDIDGIEIAVKNVFNINHTIKKIKHTLQNNIITRSWMDVYGYIYKDIQTVRYIIYLSIVLIISIACFNIINTLILCITNKRYDVAVLRAIGASKVFIRRIFLWYGFLIYSLSSIIGVGLGILVTLKLEKVDFDSINIFGNKIFPKNVYFIDFIPICLDKWDIFYIFNIVLLLGWLISWYVSYKMKTIDLAQMLK